MQAYPFSLGGVTFEARTLTFDRLIVAAPLFKAAHEGSPSEGQVNAMRDIIRIAVQGQAQAERLEQLEVSYVELRYAIGAIGLATGMLILKPEGAPADKETPPPGE